MLLRRCGLVLVGILLTLMIHLALKKLVGLTLKTKAAAAFALAAPATVLFAVLNTMVFYQWFPVPSVAGDLARWDPQQVILTSIADGLVTWYFFFAAWAAFYLALGYINEVRLAERVTAAAEAETHHARLSMLRMQVDPHFLFNALNALSSLVATGDTRTARQMIHDLAAFFRAGLGTELAGDVSISDEIKLQRLYLAIEQKRFGNRISVAWNVPEEFHAVLVPPLILQPLIENAVKYGVGGSSQPVLIEVSAVDDGAGRVRLIVRNSSVAIEPVERPSAGTGIGLANIRSRLATRYDGDAKLVSEATPTGWQAEISLPANG